MQHQDREFGVALIVGLTAISDDTGPDLNKCGHHIQLETMLNAKLGVAKCCALREEA
jgi:hypothetical protein